MVVRIVDGGVQIYIATKTNSWFSAALKHPQQAFSASMIGRQSACGPRFMHPSRLLGARKREKAGIGSIFEQVCRLS